jgi:hypothetical protein
MRTRLLALLPFLLALLAGPLLAQPSPPPAGNNTNVTVGGSPRTLGALLGTAAITATGTTQGSAAPLTFGNNVATVVPAGTGVVLTAGGVTVVTDKGASVLTVYPPSGGTIDANATNAPVLIAVNGSTTFACPTATVCGSY